jgi:hypothetical protein
MKFPKLLLVITLLTPSFEGLAQAPGGAVVPDRGEPTADLRSRNDMSQSEVKRLAEMIDQWNRVEGKSGVSPRLAKSRVKGMLAVLKVSCEVSDAVYRGKGPGEAAPHIYEAACNEGMGYLLTLLGTSLTGASCLVAGHDGSQVKCALPANSDSKAIASAVLRDKSIRCSVRELKWLGADVATLDHVEASCEEGNGYVVRVPRPGDGRSLDVIPCQDAGKLGVRCELTPTPVAPLSSDAGARPTLAWFKDALVRNGVSCETKRARIVGREAIKRRYLVEFECSDQPQGLVVFVPPAGDTVNSLESMNCLAAASRGINCQFLAEKDAPQ